ncbi:OmpL47-type beta-barrel domain-containing protein [Dyadobacter sandarakinus]|uniref:T9SS type A sorting domain-containing protein n=1 Tax=Dyadobacter sandarakinus TaxID=2747268 RepID=A0ABX7I0R4_9BACT|nr:malectin domain-containing carbohydrate-binding protein [Dyadobacter sandarakinus]QRQ99449.1 T9SS type A sorting domain-containing protein [Dyadobacter sandarakinus]
MLAGVGTPVKRGGMVADSCLPVSPLACSALRVSLPFSLSFDNAVLNSVHDKNGSGTGFTTVNSSSGSRAAEDGQPSVPGLPGYEPSKIALTSGRLQIVANKGIDYLANNNQINVLGVKVASVKKLVLEVQLINPVNASQAQQGGLWYGLDDRTFVKLGVTGNKVELRKEFNDVSSTVSGTSNPDQRRTETISGLNSKTVTLRMVVDANAQTVEGFYSTDGTNFSSTGALYATSSLGIAGLGLTTGELYAGVFATYRNGTSPVTYTFDNFAIADQSAPEPVSQDVKISFQPQEAATPAGYKADYGNAFTDARGYGWVRAADKVPGDYTGNTRVRTGTADARQLSLIQMQATTDNTAPGAWEYVIPNGTYRVTVSAGDFKYFDSKHQLNVEGLPVVADFASSSATKFRTATAVVQVSDGKLTVDASGGTGTKLNYIDIVPATAVTDGIAPAVSARLEGTQKSAGVYDKTVKVFLSATDAGNSGLKSFQYSVSEGTYVNYTVPFTLETPGNYSLKVKAADANGNETISSPYTFSIYQEPVLAVTNISFQPQGSAIAAGFTPDYGAAFTAERGYGWVSADTKVPGDYTGNTRLRTGSADVKQLGLIQMQATSDNTVPGAWEYAVENGTYTVTVSAGDFKYYDSKHQINVEGLPAVSDFAPTTAARFRTAVATVQVTDGKLTIDATGGTGTKLNYVSFTKSSAVADNTAPVASARFEGSVKSANVYDQQVKVILSATDAGASGLAEFQYSINNGSYVDYRAPFTINAGGDYSLKVRVADANGNETITNAYTFSVYVAPVVSLTKISFLPEGSPVASTYTPDYGNAYESARGYGWVNAATRQPSDYRGNMRLRAGTGDSKLLSLVQMQAPTDNTAPGAWEYAVPNGTYRVTVNAGDFRYFDSKHQINVEGLPAISDFASTSSVKFRSAVATVQVTDGKLTIDPTGGTNTKMNYLTFSPAVQVTDAVAPSISARFAGTFKSDNVYSEQVQVFLSATDEGESGLARLQYAVDGGEYLNYTSPFYINTNGTHNLVVKAADANNNERTAQYTLNVYVQPLAGAYMVVKNLDGFPGDDQATFSRIQIPWRRTSPDTTEYNANHDKVTLRLHSKGVGKLSVSNLRLSNPASWKVASINNDSTLSLPVNITTGAFTDVVIQFIGKDLSSRAKVLHDTLVITSNDSVAATKRIVLHGLFQKEGEGKSEPYAQEIINAFGFTSKVGYNANDNGNSGTSVMPSSHEIAASYFVKADPGKPVKVTQLAAYHGCCNTVESFDYFQKGSSTIVTLFTHDRLDGQSLLPRLRNAKTGVAQGTFDLSGAFGLRMKGMSSDRTQNIDGRIGLRIIKAIDANGNLVPNAYFVNGDYLGIAATNYDFQDNVYFVENVRPESGAAYYSVLESITSSDITFEPALTGTTKSMTVTLKNQGNTYPDNTTDPTISIKSVKLSGPDANQFTLNTLSVSSLVPQGTVNLTVNFKPTSVGPKNAVVLITYNNSALTPLRIPVYGIANTSNTTVQVVKRVKGAADVNVMIGNKLFEADKNYRTGSIKLDKQVTLSGVRATDMDSLYQTYLSAATDLAPTGYNIPMANGTYTLRMHFVENYWSGVGERVFTTSIENQPVLTNLDIFSEVGYRQAIVKDFPVTITDGELNINFAPTVNRVALAGLEIFEAVTNNLRVAALEDAMTVDADTACNVTVYPNPSAGNLIRYTVGNFGKNEKVAVSVLTLMNTVLHTETVMTDEAGKAASAIEPRRRLDRGFYIIRAKSESGVITSKLIIE